MRQRKIKNVDEKLAKFEYMIVSEPSRHKGKWHEIFDGEGELFLEIGCGKGRFIRGMSKKFPSDRFLAVEGQSSVLLRALERSENEELSNVKFIASYISDITDTFEEGELGGIYLNFSDPWPKERHAKRRLTHRSKLKQYVKLISPNGFVQFKTDNDSLFQFTLDEIEALGLEIIQMTGDLHNSPLADDNIMTEYEEKFSSKGKNINYVKFR